MRRTLSPDTMRRRTLVALGLAPIATSIAPAMARADSPFPSRPMRLICPFAAGGVADQVARMIAEQLTSRLGQSMIVDNRSGAAGNIGAQLVAQAAPDGYTLLFGLDSTLAANPHIYRRMPFDSIKDFSPVGMIGDVPLLIIAGPQLGVHSLDALVALSKSTPQGLAYGTPGVGSTQHLMFELIRQRTGANLVHVPYRGAAPAMVDVLGGQIPLVGAALAGSIEYIKAGKLSAIAISSAKRSSHLPDVPTFIESGMKDLVITTWHGLLLPVNAPAPLVQSLSAALNSALNDPATRGRLDAIGLIAAPTTPAEFERRIAHDLVAYGELVEAAQIPKTD